MAGHKSLQPEYASQVLLVFPSPLLEIARDSDIKCAVALASQDVDCRLFVIPALDSRFHGNDDRAPRPKLPPKSKIENPKLVDGQREGKLASFAHFAFHPNLSSMQLDELLGQG
jgi:hypothetical protein